MSLPSPAPPAAPAEPPLLRLLPGDPRHPARRHPRAAPFARAPVSVRGDPALLDRRLLALFCSREAPPPVRAALAGWVDALRDFGSTVVGGFHAAPERACLEALLAARVPVVVCPARGLGGWAVPEAWAEALAERRMALVSPFADVARRTSFRLAARRNRFVAALAEAAVVAHAAPGGWLLPHAVAMLEAGQAVWTFAGPEGAALRAAGARTWPRG